MCRESPVNWTCQHVRQTKWGKERTKMSLRFLIQVSEKLELPFIKMINSVKREGWQAGMGRRWRIVAIMTQLQAWRA